MKDDRTSRILLIFHLFYHCREVEFQEIIAYLQFQRISASQKTVSRDIQFLKQAGLVRARYSRKYKAYVPLKGNKSFVPENEAYHLLGLPEDHAKKLYMEKVIRLCTLMTKMIMEKVENPIGWYRDGYPMLSDRTRQRDFLQLKKLVIKSAMCLKMKWIPDGIAILILIVFMMSWIFTGRGHGCFIFWMQWIVLICQNLQN